MTNKKAIQRIKSEIEEGMKLTKCKKCGCMKEIIENLFTSGLMQNVKVWLKEISPIEYACLGCKHCFSAIAMNILTEKFSSLFQPASLSCNFEVNPVRESSNIAGDSTNLNDVGGATAFSNGVKENAWPPAAGEYFIFCENSTCLVAVSTLASVDFAKTLAEMRPKGLCIVGKTETENIGIDKIIKNIITNPKIRYLIVAGHESKGHYSGKTLLLLSEKGVDEDMRVIGSPGRRPVLANVSLAEVESFRRQVQLINMIGCEDAKMIINKIDELSKKTIPACKCKKCAKPVSITRISSVSKIPAGEPKKLKMDKTGYFVVIPSSEKKIIIVEHYAYDNKLLHIIEGKDASSIYSTIIENGWISELTHAAYLGRELTKAELSLKHGFRYIQDKAPGKEVITK